MKNYKLLKDLPGIPAGTLAPYKESHEAAYFPRPDGSSLLVAKDDLNKYPDFFEEVIDYKALLEEMGVVVLLHDGLPYIQRYPNHISLVASSYKKAYDFLSEIVALNKGGEV